MLPTGCRFWLHPSPHTLTRPSTYLRDRGQLLLLLPRLQLDQLPHMVQGLLQLLGSREQDAGVAEDGELKRESCVKKGRERDEDRGKKTASTLNPEPTPTSTRTLAAIATTSDVNWYGS